MSAINDGGPAFPSHGSMGEVAHEGMSMRDYFAAKALHAFIRGARDMSFGSTDEGRANCATYAACAYVMADEMLKARAA